MKKIAFLCVTYNSYPELYQYLTSLRNAIDKVQEEVIFDIFVSDNSDKEIQKIDTTFCDLSIVAFQTGNLGYFGGVNYLMKHCKITEYDYVIISNVDLILETTALQELLSSNYNQDVGWIAPCIYSKAEDRDKNPKIKNRYSEKKLDILRFLFRFPILHYLYTKSLYRRKKGRTSSPGYIYAGHGSFIVLTNEYIKRCGIIDYPVFLFCEELYLGEQLRTHGLKVYYNPSIVIYDSEHASTGEMRKKLYYKYNYTALTYIKQAFY